MASPHRASHVLATSARSSALCATVSTLRADVSNVPQEQCLETARRCRLAQAPRPVRDVRELRCCRRSQPRICATGLKLDEIAHLPIRHCGSASRGLRAHQTASVQIWSSACTRALSRCCGAWHDVVLPDCRHCTGALRCSAAAPRAPSSPIPVSTMLISTCQQGCRLQQRIAGRVDPGRHLISRSCNRWRGGAMSCRARRG